MTSIVFVIAGTFEKKVIDKELSIMFCSEFDANVAKISRYN